MDDDNFNKLTIEEQCTHKNWKARISGYSSLAQKLKDLDDECGSEWNTYVHIIRNIITDINDPALEKGLEVVKIFVDKYSVAGKTASEVVPSLVKRCLASGRFQTRALSVEICLMYIEIGRQDVVIFELLEGTGSRAPKVVSACINVINQALKEFGAKIFVLDNLLGKVVSLLEDRDANVRNCSKALIVELYRWVGPSVMPFLDHMKPSKLSEVVADMRKIQDLSPMPIRFLRSDQKDSTVVPSTSSPSQHHSGSYLTLHVNEVELSNSLQQPVCILNQIPHVFFSQVQSRKWSERRDALESLEKILSQSGRIENGNFTELTKILTNVISKDTNIAVVSLAIKCITLLATGLRIDFGPYASAIFKVLLEKLKEKKNTIICSLREAMDALFACSSLDTLSTDLIGGLSNKNPNAKSESALFLSRCFLLSSPMDLNRKSVNPLVVSLKTALNDQDPTVRNSAAKALGVVVRIVGEKKFSHMLGEIDHQKMVKIREYASSTELKTFQRENTTRRDEYGKATGVSILDSSRSGEAHRVRMNPSFLRKNNAKTTQKAENMSNQKELIPLASSKRTIQDQKDKSKDNLKIRIPEAVIAGMSHTNWAIRLQAVSDLLESIEQTHQIPSNVEDVVELLSCLILDNNPKTATKAISVVSVSAKRMGGLFTNHVPTFVPSLLKCTGDPKKWVSKSAIECLDSLSKYCGFVEIFKSGSLIEVLKLGSQISRIRLWQWVSKSLHCVTLKDIPRELLEKYLVPLFISLEDRNLEIRNSASVTGGVLINLLGLDAVLSTSESYFKGHNNPLTKLLNKNESLELGSTRDKYDSTSCEETNSGTSKHLSKNEGRSPLLDSNNLKHQRLIDEQKSKIMKWEFTTPRAEFVDLLKSLMFAANFSQPLMNNMFHDEFKNQLEAMDMLLEELQHNSQSFMSNLDLILRWLTLRFFDTCPIVLGKALDFLFVTVEILKSNNYCLLDCEASILVPYVILKMADPREKVQMKVKDILLKLSDLYPVSKLKKFIMDGLRTKSVRQKVNCLEVLNFLIDTYGETVYIRDLDVMAEQIVKLLSDRDSDIKRSALSVAASLFSQDGQKMLKFIEKYAGKEAQSIEQRLRKSATTRRAASNILPLQSMPCTLVKNNENKQPSEIVSIVEEMVSNSNEHLTSIFYDPTVSPGLDANAGKFNLEGKLLDELDSVVNIPVRFPTVTEVDIEFLKEEKPRPSLFQFKPSETFELHDSSSNPQENSIDGVVNEDLTLSIRAMIEIDNLFKTEKYSFLRIHIDSILHKIAQQLHNLAQINNPDKFRCYGMTFTLLLTVFSSKTFVDVITKSNMCYVLEQMLLLISNNIFDRTDNGNYRAAVNTIILKILENGRKTDILCGLLEMMGGWKDTTLLAGKIHELQMKCLWKLNKSQPSWDAELDYTEVFKSMRTLIKTYSFPWWTSKITNNSLRTLKTILRTMVRMRGEQILNDAKINLSSEEDYGLYIYLRKLLKSMKMNKKVGMEIDVWPSHDSMIYHAQELSDIFKTVSSEPTDGMKRLNKFSDDYPEVDLHDILSKVSPNLFKYFLWFNEKRPDDISCAVSSVTSVSARNLMTKDEFSEEVLSMWNKLKVLQERIRSA